MTEQKFPCEGIGISLRGNWNFLAREFMRYAAGLRTLGIVLVLLGLGANWNGAWGQQNIIVQKNSIQLPSYAVGSSHEIRYVIPYTDYTIQIQRVLRDNLNGYMRWYRINGSEEDTEHLSNKNDYSLAKYANGFVWYGNTTAPAGIITYNNSMSAVETIAYEASSIRNYETQNGYLQTASTVTVRRSYEMRDATGREADLAKCKSNLEENLDWKSDLTNATDLSLDVDKIESIRDAFFQQMEIHTPMKAGTSYRLEEVLNNYVVKDDDSNLQYPNRVRWRVYDENGELNTKGSFKYTYKQKVETGYDSEKGELIYTEYTLKGEYPITYGYVTLQTGSYTLAGSGQQTIDGDLNAPNIFPYYYNIVGLNEKEQHKFYLTAEVSYNNEKWYPAVFITVYLEPNAEPKVQEELIEERSDDFLKENYEQLGEGVTFDDANNLAKPTIADNNYPLTTDLNSILKANSYYAYAAPRFYTQRRWGGATQNTGNRFVGSGEYGLYKSLGLQNVSQNVSPQNNASSETGIYYANYGMESYQAQVYDRSHEKDSGKYGYFFYVDAAEEAGVITRISLGKDALCPNTRLVVTAWVCNLNTTKETEKGYINADIGLIFKGLDADDNEIVLNTFYSGEISNEPATASGFTTEARWQQVFFTFDYHSNTYANIDFEDYILEVTNNCRNTYGADYAIDDIKIYRSLPRIEVERISDCDASMLKVQTDVSLLYTNVGWRENQVVPSASTSMNDFSTRKYRYGLSGVDSDDTEYIGNIYFGFMEGFVKGNEGQAVGDGDGAYHWVTINNDIPETERTSKVARAIISTKKDIIPTDSLTATQLERVMNLQAVLDFNKDVDAIKAKTNDFNIDETEAGNLKRIENPIEQSRVNELRAAVGKDSWNMTEAEVNQYNILLEALYSQLHIPRIRCSWLDGDDGTLRLSTIDVSNTDLKCYGEIIKNEDGTETTASGNYHVMVFTAAQVAGAEYVEPHGRCALVSPFTVRGVITINIQTDARYETALCVDAQRRIEAVLRAYDDNNNEVDIVGDYIFDWYLGPATPLEFGEDNSYMSYIITTSTGEDITIQEALKRYRNSHNNSIAEISIDDLNDWTAGDENIKEALISLIQNEMLQTGTPGGEEGFTMYVRTEEIVAIPYIPDPLGTNIHYCTDVSPVNFELAPIETPILYPGYDQYEDESLSDDIKKETAYLRLGRRHISSTIDKKITLENIPIRTNVKMATGVSYLGLSKEGETVVTWVNPQTNNVEEVGIATSMKADNHTEGALTFYLFPVALEYFQEGGTYELRIPFVQYDGSDNVLSSQCDGLASLYIKIVPEYLTWQSNSESTAIWYDDENWNQSTEGELYFDQGATVGSSGKDANGSDVIANAFSPLYFTKITLRSDKPELKLDEKLDVTGRTIQYDMAVDTVKPQGQATEGKIEVVPYYINKVDQIYFKPNATLLNQHHLNYQKAWVEFEMANMEKRWMASPLQNVYAGDIYAPKSNGRQETAAFTDIIYNTSLNSRWAPAFYQKAWNSAVKYSKVEGERTDDEIATVSVVKNNWSIEYNDVTVQYPIGKGFYLSVEDIPDKGKTLVRLPKADVSYKYESAPRTKALNTTTRTGKAGRLAELDPTNEGADVYVVQLDNAYNNGHYYLIGNPAMAYLKMDGDDGFLAKNGITKYWTYQEGTFSATVDQMTEDGVFTAEGLTNGYIAPMQAFFIEWPDSKRDNADKKVTFTPDMFVPKPGDSGTEAITTYSAFNPTLVLTAERGDQRSVAKLAIREDAHDGYEESEDAIALIDSELDVPVVYTVAGTSAAQVNALQTIRNVGLGIYDEAGGEVTLAIEGMSQLAEPLYLYDAQTRKSVELVGDRYELTVEGESHGRYFLQSGLSTSNDRIQTGDDISIYSLRPGEIVATTVGTPLRSVRVYGIGGELVAQQSLANQPVYRLRVPGNAIYVVYAEDADGIIRNVKLRVR